MNDRKKELEIIINQYRSEVGRIGREITGMVNKDCNDGSYLKELQSVVTTLQNYQQEYRTLINEGYEHQKERIADSKS